MAYIEPNSDIILLSQVPFDPTYENTMYFEYERDQLNYFRYSDTLNRLTLTEYSYLRKTRNQIKVELPILNARFYNYMMFRNTSFEGKWFYAFITEMEYINNNTAVITFELDLMQTWMFDYDFNQCIIEREHTESDNIGEHIIEENLETGEYVYYRTRYEPFDPVIILVATQWWDNATQTWITPSSGVVQGRVGTGEGSYYFPAIFVRFDPNSQTGLDALHNRIEHYTENNKIGAIVGMFMADKTAWTPGQSYQDITVHVQTTETDTNYYISGYKVHNKKLMCFPYNYLQVSNLTGEAVDYRWEFFDDPESVVLKRWGNQSMNPGVVLYACDYKGLQENYEEIVTSNNFPQCAFNNDTYKAWLAQNRGMLAAGAIGIGASVGMGVANIASGSGLVSTATSLANSGMMSQDNAGREIHYGVNQQKAGLQQVVGGLTGALAMLGKMYDHYTLPPTRHGGGNGDLMYQAAMNGFQISKKCITRNYAERIDKFFTMYGYRVNRVGKPSLDNRPYYTYVKTSGCSLKPLVHSGGFEVPANDSRAIEAIYNKGIRFWKTSAVFGSFDYDDNDNTPNS